MQAADLARIAETKTHPEYFRRKRARSPPPVYNARGDRINTQEHRIKAARAAVSRELAAIGRVWGVNASTMPDDGALPPGRVSRKIPIPESAVSGEGWRAIIGARGTTHQQLEKETGCRISVAGKGVASRSRAGVDDSLEPPHAVVTGDTEEAVQLAADKIEFILSDTPEANLWRAAKMAQIKSFNGEAIADRSAGAPGGIRAITAAPPAPGPQAPPGESATTEMELDELFAAVGGAPKPTGPSTAEAVAAAARAALATGDTAGLIATLLTSDRVVGSLLGGQTELARGRAQAATAAAAYNPLVAMAGVMGGGVMGGGMMGGGAMPAAMAAMMAAAAAAPPGPAPAAPAAAAAAASSAPAAAPAPPAADAAATAAAMQQQQQMLLMQQQQQQHQQQQQQYAAAMAAYAAANPAYAAAAAGGAPGGYAYAMMGMGGYPAAMAAPMYAAYPGMAPTAAMGAPGVGMGVGVPGMGMGMGGMAVGGMAPMGYAAAAAAGAVPFAFPAAAAGTAPGAAPK